MTTAIQTDDDKARLKLYNEMTPPLQAVCDKMAEHLSKCNAAEVLTAYNIGSLMSEVMTKEAVYGSIAALQLAAYHNVPGGVKTLGDYKNFAETYKDKEGKAYVTLWSQKPTPDKHFLTVAHWLCVVPLEEAEAREKYLAKAIKGRNGKGLSAKQLLLEIRSGGDKKKHRRGGGRKPGVPTSAVTGLQRTFQLAQQFVNYKDTLDSIVDNVAQMAPDAIDDNLLARLQQTRKMVGNTEANAHAMALLLDNNIERVERVLAQKESATPEPDADSDGAPSADAATPAAGAAPAPRPRGRPKKSATGGAASNGHTGKGKKPAKKKAARRPTAAV